MKLKSMLCFFLLLVLLLAGACTKNDCSDTDPGVVIDGISWATCNVDAPGTFASSPESPGMFYQWNRKKGWSISTPGENEPMSGWDPSCPSGTSWEKINDPCPSGWRVPTIDELESLLNTGSTWTTLNGQTGRLFGSGSNSIFLPAAGFREDDVGMLINAGWYGLYWGGTEDAFVYARGLIYYSDYAYMGEKSRNNGLSIRCVAE